MVGPQHLHLARHGEQDLCESDGIPQAQPAVDADEGALHRAIGLMA
ncbi:hypothetical protein ACT6QG_09770 [Xanthobacter sp. TB0136]